MGAEHLPTRFVKRLQRMEPSFSAFVVYAATSLDLRERRRARDVPLHALGSRGDAPRHPRGPAGRHVGERADARGPLAGTGGEHLVILTSLAPYDIGRPWDEVRDAYAEQMLDDFDAALFPGLKDNLTFMETATPLTLRALHAQPPGIDLRLGGDAEPGRHEAARPRHARRRALPLRALDARGAGVVSRDPLRDHDRPARARARRARRHRPDLSPRGPAADDVRSGRWAKATSAVVRSTTTRWSSIGIASREMGCRTRMR